MVFGLLGMLAMPVWAEEKQDMMLKKSGWHEFKNGNENARVEDERCLLQSQPNGTAKAIVPRFEFSDQPTRSHERLSRGASGVNARQSPSGRDIHLFIRGSK